jgi:hypothetical protein
MCDLIKNNVHIYLYLIECTVLLARKNKAFACTICQLLLGTVDTHGTLLLN